MKPISRRAALGAFAMVAAAGRAVAAAPQAVRLRAADGVTVFGTEVAAEGAARGTVLLFHMADSSAAEWAPMQPKLAALGFASLAIDQRSGGDFFGPNRTAAQFGGDPGYAAALPDLEAALAARAPGAPGGGAIVCGSSYSAALVFVLAARHPGMVRAVLAFSPGEFIEGVSVRAAAARVRCPVFIAAAPGEVEDAQAIAAAVPGGRAVLYRPRAGVHGASTLRADRNPAGAAANWDAVAAFLTKL